MIRHLNRAPRQGFTLVEMIVTLVLFALMAVTMMVFFRPAFDTWLTTRTRTAMAADTDQALRRMLRDVRVAVPNSIRTPSTNCFELVPTTGGGRYRMAIDTVNGNSVAVDPGAATTAFDVLTPLAKVPAVGDYIVVDNQNPGDVYAGTNRSTITSVTTPAATAGRHRLGIGALQIPIGYDGGRFNVVAASQQAVFYVCSGASTTLDSNGNAPGVLYRMKAYGFNASAPTSCPGAAAAGADVLLTGVRSCRFLYNANQGATQQSGFISLQIEVTQNRETASLVVGAHVANTP
ncbi:MAG: prepilin-type cleavage/methylation domain-containing protein [Burkholderiales bacterium PBB5]|nr:MAG: prepilin-type cleavage/methylation domain-containing protein [Burkholderiales bacterium PBB5]